MTIMTGRCIGGRSISRVTGRRLRGSGRKRLGGGGGRLVSGDSVVAAVTRDLAAIGRRDAELGCGALASLALAMAAEIDEPGNSATSKSMCARVLADTLERLAVLAPVEEGGDRIDELGDKRAKRLSAATA